MLDPYKIARRIGKKVFRLRNKYYLDRLRGKYSGQRGFVIGNGPSLSISDLDRLQGEISIASNRIYLAFDQTKWRPTFYINISDLQIPKYKTEIEQYFSRVYAPERVAPLLGYWRCRAYRQLKPISAGPESEVLFSDNLSHGAYGGFTVTFEALQLAVHIGLNPIYLIGCDHKYIGQPKVTAPNSVLNATDTNDHFHPNYRRKGETINPAQIDIMTMAYEHARKYAQSNSINIYNATRGGSLETFERVCFDDIVK